MSVRLKPLARQVIVITGASSGIGLAAARTAAAKGAKVVLVARDGDALAEAAAAIAAAGGEADFAVADVGDLAQVEAAAARAVERFGRIDAWVNNAGVAIYAKLLETPGDEHARMFRTNYFGMVHGHLAAVPHLSEGGAIVTVGSAAGDMPTPIMAAYAASKHAVHAYVESLRIELRQAGLPISLTLVKPSGIDTPIARHAANHEGGEAQVPPPAYHPQLVADAILDACVRPRRAITVGGAGRAQVLFATHFPALFERLAPLAAKAFIDKDKVQPEAPNLFDAGIGGRERSGELHALRTSLYTAAARHPKTSGAVMAGLVGVGAAVYLRRRTR